MKVEVVVPWRAGCPQREAAWAWVSARWVDLGWPVTVAEPPSGPWVKAAAVMPAVEASTADVVIVADADVWCDAIPVAVDAVMEDAVWAVPHLMVHRLTEQATIEVLAGKHPCDVDHQVEESPYRGVVGGGLVVLRRAVAVDVPMPRMAGWGSEDYSWGYALRTLYGDPRRSEAPLWHLWHPPQQRLNRRVGSQVSETLRRRYQRAQNDRAAMRALVDEAKAVTCG